jgi:hypothetical protein
MVSAPVLGPNRPNPTTVEEKKRMKPDVEDSTLTNPEQQISEEQGKHLNGDKQDSQKTQNVVCDFVKDTEHITLEKMSNKSDTVCKNSDSLAKTLQATYKQTNKQKRITKIPKTKSDDFLWT